MRWDDGVVGVLVFMVKNVAIGRRIGCGDDVVGWRIFAVWVGVSTSYVIGDEFVFEGGFQLCVWFAEEVGGFG